jgi:RNA polymerase sigma-70 factor (ECF subfamily)
LEEAEDAVQEIFVKVLNAAEVPVAFRPWIYRIARNQCLNMLRGKARRKDGAAQAVPSQIDADLTGQLTGMVKDEMHEKLLQMVQNLGDEHREALRLRYVEGLSRAEIAEVLAITEAAVKRRLFDGLKNLKANAPDLEIS